MQPYIEIIEKNIEQPVEIKESNIYHTPHSLPQEFFN